MRNIFGSKARSSNIVKYLDSWKRFHFRDGDWTPPNKLHGSVEAVAELEVIRNPVKGWVEIRVNETVHHKSGRVVSRSTAITLDDVHANQLVKYLTETYKESVD